MQADWKRVKRAGQAVVLGVGLATAAPAAAQNPYAPAFTVNETVVTHYEIDQRARFLEALGASGNLRQLAVEQLTEDRIKVQAGRALGLELPEQAIEAGIVEFAEQRGITLEDVERVLAARGIGRQTLVDFVESGLIWREIVGARFRARAMPTEADLDAALEVAATTPVEVVQLAEIAIPFQEHGEQGAIELADRLARDLQRGASFSAAVRQYSRSASVEQDGVLPPIPARQLPPAVRGQILLMSPGQVTNPIPIAGGVAILRLVSIRAEPPAALPDVPEAELRERLREDLFNQRITSFSQGYLQELMGDALIVER